MSEDDLKRKAAHAALDLLPERGLLGLGTGSTTRWFIEAVGDLVRAGRQFVAVPTSQASRRLAQAGSASPCSTTPAPGRSSCASTAPTRSARRWT